MSLCMHLSVEYIQIDKLHADQDDLYLNDVILEADILFLLSRSVLHIEATDQVSSPTPQQSIEDLETHA